MLKPSAPAMPGMTDTLDFVKNLWGSMQIPGTGLPGMPGMAGIAAPPMSSEDLDKRIADLRAVESWLNLNLTMLRGSIQALEVQRGTLMTLKTMGASMAEAMRQSGVSAEKMAAMPFASFFSAQGQGGGAAAKPAAGATAARPGTPAPPAPAPAPAHAPAPAAPGAPTAGAVGGGTAQPGAAAPLPSGAPDMQNNPAAMAMPAAVAWWNMLQDQFTQAVASAMAPAAAAAASSAPPAQDGAGAKPKTEAPKPAPKAGTGAANASGGNEVGSGRRVGRPKADKGTP
jgi:hypothetical protein